MFARLLPGTAWHLPTRPRFGAPARVAGLKRAMRGPSPFAEAWRRWRTRRMLTELDARALRDIGVSSDQARAEAAKPFWRP